MGKIVVTYLVSTLGRTGPTNQLFNLVSRLDRSCFVARIVTISTEPNDSRIWDFQKLDIPVITLKRSRVGSIFLGSASLSRILETNPTNVLHSQGIRADFLSSLSRQPCARISTQRNDPFQDYPKLFGTTAGSIAARIHKTILLNIPHVISCSFSIEDANVRRGIPCLTIQNGISTDHTFLVPRKTKLATRARLGLPQKPLLFISVGPLIYRKNALNLIRAFGQAANPSARHLVLLGAGPLMAKVQRLTEEFKNVTAIGHVENVDEYLQAADCFLSASESEGLPNAVIEALAWGLPFILSNIPAHREIQLIRNEAGDLFPLRDHRVLTELIENFVPSDEATFAARSIASETLNANVMARRYQDLYESVVKRSTTHE